MAILKNVKLANKEIATAFGNFKFSEEGITEMNYDLAVRLAELKDFSLVEEEDEAEEEDAESDVQIDETEAEEDVEEENLITREELEKMTVKQLEKYAKDNEIDLGDATKKADIVSVILGE